MGTESCANFAPATCRDRQATALADARVDIVCQFLEGWQPRTKRDACSAAENDVTIVYGADEVGWNIGAVGEEFLMGNAKTFGRARAPAGGWCRFTSEGFLTLAIARFFLISRCTRRAHAGF
jgi:hypothetical protein